MVWGLGIHARGEFGALNNKVPNRFAKIYEDELRLYIQGFNKGTQVFFSRTEKAIDAETLSHSV